MPDLRIATSPTFHPLTLRLRNLKEKILRSLSHHACYAYALMLKKFHEWRQEPETTLKPEHDITMRVLMKMAIAN